MCRENMADINVRVREVKSSSKVGKKKVVKMVT